MGVKTPAPKGGILASMIQNSTQGLRSVREQVRRLSSLPGRWKHPVLRLGIGLALFLAGCAPLGPAFPTPSITPATPSATATATVIWFPSTATPTSLPAATRVLESLPTPAPVPETQLYADSFDEAGGWVLGRVAAGSALLGKSELTIAVARPRGYIDSLLEGYTFGDFYLEITASPSICRGDDEYGILLRVTPEADYYRYGLTCDGRARVDRIYNGQASSPQPPLSLAAIPAGAPSNVRLGINAKGQVLEFFVNGELLFTVRDSLFYSGGIGLFAHAGGADAVTVNFTDLVIYSIPP